MTGNVANDSTPRYNISGYRNSEQTMNNALGQLLRNKNVRWKNKIDTEKSGIFSDDIRKRPDIVVYHPGGLPVLIESEFEPARTVENDATSRLGKSLSRDGRTVEQTIALQLPASLIEANQDNLYEILETSKYRYCLYYQHRGEDSTDVRWPKRGWIEGGIDDFVNFIEQTALSESIIAQGMIVLEQKIGIAASVVRDDDTPNLSTHTTIANLLNQKDSVQTTRMAMAILANAISFHNAIAKLHKIRMIDKLRDTQGNYCQGQLNGEWRFILSNINYWPIFKIASEILSSMRREIADHVFSLLADAALELEKIGATSQHDLSGRMFQRLITDRKFLATFYTLPSSSALLAELAISRLDVNWSKQEEISILRIADFACGTGALLNAAYSSVLCRFRRTGGDDSKIHPQMIEKTIVGTDIMPAATHLTASILSSTHPAIPFNNTQIITLPYGKNTDLTGEPIEIGSLDLIKDEDVFSLFKTGQERLAGTKSGDKEYVPLPHKSFDLVIMNPPFTRPTGHEGKAKGIPIPAFAGFSTSDDEQRQMSKKLSGFRLPNSAGHGNAGLASNFIDVAEAKVKETGVVALVLPATFASGNSWSAARKLFERHYKDIIVVSIASTGSTNRAFSADTGMAEVLVIATRNSKESSVKPSITYVNLDCRPSSILEANEIARAINQVDEHSAKGSLKIGDEIEIGQFIRSESGFSGYAGIRDNDVAIAASDLDRLKFTLPRMKGALDIPLTELGELGERGLYSLDINGTERVGGGLQRGPFNVKTLNQQRKKPNYPMLWAHNASRETKLIVDPDRYGDIRTGQDDQAVDLWEKYAGRLSFNRDFRINSQPLSACFASTVVLSGQAWHGFNCKDSSHEIPILLFSNTIIGLIAYWWKGTRQQEGRARLPIKNLPSLITIDTRRLAKAQIEMAFRIFEKFSKLDLLPANEAFRDKVRQDLDQAVFVELLGLNENILESLNLLRFKWCLEPSVHGGKKTQPDNQSTMI